MSAPDKPTPLFAHDFQTWLPLEFDGGGAILPLRFVENFTIQLRSLKIKMEDPAIAPWPPVVEGQGQS